ncbi:MAG: hypothetical protein MK089_05355 [Phycisphaerales bacterium]|nr:hypothetical protein [Phycisphaerales bacterium]
MNAGKILADLYGSLLAVGGRHNHPIVAAQANNFCQSAVRKSRATFSAIDTEQVITQNLHQFIDQPFAARLDGFGRSFDQFQRHRKAFKLDGNHDLIDQIMVDIQDVASCMQLQEDESSAMMNAIASMKSSVNRWKADAYREQKVEESVAQPISYTFKKGLLGKVQVVFRCQRCGELMTASAGVIGNLEQCSNPRCNHDFIVPGEASLADHRKRAKEVEEQYLDLGVDEEDPEMGDEEKEFEWDGETVLGCLILAGIAAVICWACFMFLL